MAHHNGKIPSGLMDTTRMPILSGREEEAGKLRSLGQREPEPKQDKDSIDKSEGFNQTKQNMMEDNIDTVNRRLSSQSNNYGRFYGSDKEAKNGDTVKKVKELTNILLDTRFIIRTEHNFFDPVSESGYGKEAINESPDIKISRSTMVRAEMVKQALGMKYYHIQRVSDWKREHNNSSIYDRAKTVYNPLQVIRNRAIRAKYHDTINTPFVRSAPLACNVFSSHNKKKDRKNGWKFLWAVDVGELVGDMNWRRTHWHELRKSNGELWFPPSANGYSSQSSNNDDSIKLLTERMTEEMSREEFTKESNGMDTGALLPALLMGESFSNNVSSENLRRNSKRESYGKQSETSPSSMLSSSDEDRSYFNLKGSLEPHESASPVVQKNGHLRPHEKENGTINADSKNINSSSDRLVVPTIKINSNYDSNDESTAMADENIPTQKENKEQSKNDDGWSPDGVSLNSQTTNAKILESADESMRAIEHNVSSFEMSLILKHNFLSNIEPTLNCSVDLILLQILDERLPKSHQIMSEIDENQLPRYNSQTLNLYDEAKEVLHNINEEHLIKVDNLLSNTDRSIGEINTSMALELKKANERLGRLNNSLFGKFVTTQLENRRQNMGLSETWSTSFLYLLLENLIVAMLRCIWILTNIYSLIASLFSIILKILWFIWKILF